MCVHFFLLILFFFFYYQPTVTTSMFLVDMEREMCGVGEEVVMKCGCLTENENQKKQVNVPTIRRLMLDLDPATCMSLATITKVFVCQTVPVSLVDAAVQPNVFLVTLCNTKKRRFHCYCVRIFALLVISSLNSCVHFFHGFSFSLSNNSTTSCSS